MPVRDRYRGANAGVQSRWGLAGTLPFFSAGMPAADGIGLAGLGFDDPSSEFVASVFDLGAWPATGGGAITDTYNALMDIEKSEVDALVRQGIDIYNAISQVVTGTVQRTAAPVGGMAGVSPLLLLGGAAIAFTLLSKRKR